MPCPCTRPLARVPRVTAAHGSETLQVEVRSIEYVIIYVYAPFSPPQPPPTPPVLPPPDPPPPAGDEERLAFMQSALIAAAALLAALACLCCCAALHVARRRLRKQAFFGTSRMLQPPTCRWGGQAEFACFLSDFKNDLLQRMLRAKVRAAARACQSIPPIVPCAAAPAHRCF